MLTQTKIPSLTVSNPWWGHDPSDKQWHGLYGYEDCPDLFYGGAAGPGKTSYLLMAAVQYVQYPHYRALILRKTYADLSLPDAWRKRYAIRAGIEGTNSELKRAHGLGRLRVRGGRRVRLAVYLKALACNFKRMVHARLVEMENTAQRAVGTVPAVAAA